LADTLTMGPALVSVLWLTSLAQPQGKPVKTEAARLTATLEPSGRLPEFQQLLPLPKMPSWAFRRFSN
jgi:hypothetical protein